MRIHLLDKGLQGLLPSKPSTWEEGSWPSLAGKCCDYLSILIESARASCNQDLLYAA